MSIDFNEYVDRRGSSCVKWNVLDGELPMWIADMDFHAADPIRKAIEKRAAHGVFGYAAIDPEWYEAVRGWWSRRHGFTPEKDQIMFSTGVVPSLSSIVRKLTTPAENIIIQTPVYNIFFNSILNNGRNIIENPLIYKDGEYSIDFADLEKKMALPTTSMMILCNPHNPVGKIWDKKTLAKIGELAFKHGVTVVSDEIHCDLTRPGYDYVPYLSASETCKNNGIMCCAPSKAFNIAGLQTSAIIIPNKHLFNRVNRAINTDEVAEPNVFAIPAAIAAFNEGDEWIDGLREHVFKNRAYAEERLKKECPEIKLVVANATYLLWADCSAITCDAGDFQEFLRRTTGLFVTAGECYGKNGRSFLRINIACPFSTLEDGVNRLISGAKQYIERKNIHTSAGKIRT